MIRKYCKALCTLPNLNLKIIENRVVIIDEFLSNKLLLMQNNKRYTRS